jgi:predicted ATPase
VHEDENGWPQSQGRKGQPLLAGGALDSWRTVIVDEFHERGVALADLHHRDVLLAADGTLYVLDLATAWVAGERPGPLRRYLFERFCESDRVNLARMRARFTGGDVEAAVASVSPAAAAWHRRGRKVKTILDRLRGKAVS